MRPSPASICRSCHPSGSAGAYAAAGESSRSDSAGSPFERLLAPRCAARRLARVSAGWRNLFRLVGGEQLGEPLGGEEVAEIIRHTGPYLNGIFRFRIALHLGPGCLLFDDIGAQRILIVQKAVERDGRKPGFDNIIVEYLHLLRATS